MAAKVSVLPPMAQVTALRATIAELRGLAARKVCPNPLQTLRVAELLQEVADTIEAILLARGARAAIN